MVERWKLDLTRALERISRTLPELVEEVERLNDNLEDDA